MAKKKNENSIDNEAVPDEELKGKEAGNKEESSEETGVTVNDALTDIYERLHILELKTGLRTY